MQRRDDDQRNLWLLSGTGEGPPLATSLIKKGWKVSVSVVTAKASLAYRELPLEALWVGRLNGVKGIQEVLKCADSYGGFKW